MLQKYERWKEQKLIDKNGKKIDLKWKNIMLSSDLIHLKPMSLKQS